MQPDEEQLLICHRNRLFSDCLERVLQREELHFDTIVSQNSPDLNGHRPRTVLLDSSLEDDQLGTRIELLRSAGTSNIVLFVPDASRKTVSDCVLANVDACVVEETTSLNDLLTALRTVINGGHWFSPEFVRELIKLHRDTAPDRLLNDGPSCALTAREIEVVQLIAWERLGNKQIARRLKVSVFTVKNHVHNIIEKLGVSDRYEAADYAESKRWIGSVPARSS